MVTRQAPTMGVGVLPGFCIWYGLLVSEQGTAPAPATGGGRMLQRPQPVRGVLCTGSAEVASHLSR